MLIKGVIETEKKPRRNGGILLVEVAILTPILLAILMVTLEFGSYFIRSITVEKAANSIVNYLKTASPNSTNEDASKIKNQIQKIVEQQSYNFFKLEFCGTTDNVIIDPNCSVKQFARAETQPLVDSHNSYSVQILVYTEYKALTPLPKLIGLPVPKYIFYRTSVVVPPTK